MYLKRVEALGFKSFANKIGIDFTPEINGIVGPNGCGKSNVIDAIRWVLGEQSTKNLRAQGMSDVIFSGSEDHKKQNMAEVTLIFDNSDRMMNIDYNEVAITRRIYRNGDSEYLLNKSKCRLKDVVELIMDTSLGKDSLAMISQGAIANFAQAKPIERRAIFEEAAGVSKYKKRKLEALRKLEKTNDNLLRINDIIVELKSQLEPLKEQAERTKIYFSKKERLEQIEVSVIVFDVEAISEKLTRYTKDLNDLKQDIVYNENKLINEEQLLDNLKGKLNEYDTIINQLQDDLMNKVSEITSLEKQKSEQDNIMYQDKSKEYVTNLSYRLNDTKLEIDGLDKSLEELLSTKNNLDNQYYQLNDNLLAEENKINEKQNTINNLRSQKEKLVGIYENNSRINAGVKTIIDAKASLSGIIGLVSDLFEVEEKYQDALSRALQSSLQNIVIETKEDVKRAVKFLKDNQAGRATFMPLESIKAKYVRDEDLYVASNVDGYIDIATNLISFESEYQNIFEYLLNTTFITNDLNSALKLSSLTNQRYRVISLEGDVINAGGVVTGGKEKNRTGNRLTLKNDIIKIEERINDLFNELRIFKDEYSFKNRDLNDLRNKINQINITIAKIESNRDNKNNQFLSLKNEYYTLTKKEFLESDNFEIPDYINAIRDANMKKEKLIANIKANRESSLEVSNEISQLEKTVKEYRSIVSENNKNISKLELKINTNQIELKNYLDRLAQEYHLTFDSAKEKQLIKFDHSLAKKEVIQLKNEISNLGPINPLAIEEYEKVNERYSFLDNQQQDLEKAKIDLLQMINDTDKEMVDRFKQTINDINQELPLTFKKLFGGGYARLEYSDPSNILETGIEIIAHPPGKSIQNLSLFSGGEKALIALSVLFAIMKVRPLPLCILDEVEAALDQANVERFAKFLKDFSKTTQFIIITHRPGTMEQCDVLYGITMQEKGISKMISVRIEEAKNLIA